MNRSQLPRSVPHCALRPASPRCVPVSILLSDARVVAPSARQSQSSRQRLSLPARDANGNALLSCSALGSHQERFRSIRFTPLSPRGGTRTLMVNPILPEGISRSVINCVGRCRVFAWIARPRQSAAQTIYLLHRKKGNLQCRTRLYLCIECTSPHCSLPAFLGIRAIHVLFTLTACQIPAMIAFRAKRWSVSALILHRPHLP